MLRHLIYMPQIMTNNRFNFTRIFKNISIENIIKKEENIWNFNIAEEIIDKKGG